MTFHIDKTKSKKSRSNSKTDKWMWFFLRSTLVSTLVLVTSILALETRMITTISNRSGNKNRDRERIKESLMNQLTKSNKTETPSPATKTRSRTLKISKYLQMLHFGLPKVNRTKLNNNQLLLKKRQTSIQTMLFYTLDLLFLSEKYLNLITIKN